MAASLSKLGPQGAPRGLLVYWVLHRISKSPSYGFELLKEIEAKSEGAWRPGPGSLYPLLKTMVSLGYIEGEKAKTGRPDQHLFRITKKGIKQLEEKREVFRTMGKRWNSLRGIFVDVIEPRTAPDFILAGSRQQFEMAKHLVEANREKIPEVDLRSMLREYSVMLEAQQGWVNRELREAPPLVRRHHP